MLVAVVEEGQALLVGLVGLAAVEMVEIMLLEQRELLILVEE